MTEKRDDAIDSSAPRSSHCSCGADIAGDLKTKRERADELIKRIDRYLPKWRTWFPNEQSTVEVPRDELLAMKEYAELGLKCESEEQLAFDDWFRYPNQGHEVSVFVSAKHAKMAFDAGRRSK